MLSSTWTASLFKMKCTKKARYSKTVAFLKSSPDTQGPKDSASSTSPSQTSSCHQPSPQLESSSFINFHEDASSLQKIVDTGGTVEGQVRDTNLEKSKLSSSSFFEPNTSNPLMGPTERDEEEFVTRSGSPGYSSIQTCLCIKMEFCDFTLEHFLDSLRKNRPLYPDLPSLFDNVSSFVNFKADKSNLKFGAFCPLYMTSQLLDGLIFIHNLGIIHRDLKPANIFIMQARSYLYHLQQIMFYLTPCMTLTRMEK